MREGFWRERRGRGNFYPWNLSLCRDIPTAVSMSYYKAHTLESVCQTEKYSLIDYRHVYSLQKCMFFLCLLHLEYHEPSSYLLIKYCCRCSKVWGLAQIWSRAGFLFLCASCEVRFSVAGVFWCIEPQCWWRCSLFAPTQPFFMVHSFYHCQFNSTSEFLPRSLTFLYT